MLILWFYVTGGCKHVIAVISWLHRRSEEPAPTTVQCYWKKATLAKVGTTMKYVKAFELSERKSASVKGTTDFFSEVIAHEQKNNISSTMTQLHQQGNMFEHVKISKLVLIYRKGQNHGQDFQDFAESVTNNFSFDIFKATTDNLKIATGNLSDLGALQPQNCNRHQDVGQQMVV